MKTIYYLYIAVFFFICFFFLSIFIINGNTFFFDVPVYEWLQTWPRTDFFKVITNAGELWFLLILIVISLVLLRKKEQRQLFLGTMVVEAVLNILLKYFFSRERPGFPHLVEVSGYSFPSGHMMAVTTFSFLILYFIWHSKMSKVKKGIFSIPFILYVVLIGLSRIYLGVHFASDVLGAFCLAVGLVSFFIFLSRSLK